MPFSISMPVKVSILKIALAIALVLGSSLPLHAQSPAKSSGALPSMGDTSELPAASERRIGQRIAASIYRDPDYMDDPVLQDYLLSIWQPLMDAARARGDITPELSERFAWELFLIRDRSVNAFALPGGYLGIHLGLISTVSNRDELAAVLGHELSHVTQRHISRLISQQDKSAPWMIGAMILGALAASKNPQVASALMTSGQAVAVQNQLNFSRDMEREADRIGLSVMTDAGFDPRGAGSMFEKLQQASRLNDNGSFGYLRSHPLSIERMAEVQARLQLAPVEKPNTTPAKSDAALQTQTLHTMMAARAKVLSNPGADVLRALLQEAQRAASNAANNSNRAGTLYGGILAAAKLREHTLAQSLMSQLSSVVSGKAGLTRAASLLQIEIDLLASRVPATAASLDINQPKERAELLLQSRALLAAGRAGDVSGRLSTWVANNPQDSTAWQLLATAFGNQNQTVRAIRADAESQVARLDYAAALDRFKAAQNMLRSNPASGDFMESSIIDARTRQVDLLLREQAAQDKLDSQLQR